MFYLFSNMFFVIIVVVTHEPSDILPHLWPKELLYENRERIVSARMARDRGVMGLLDDTRSQYAFLTLTWDPGTVVEHQQLFTDDSVFLDSRFEG